MKFLSILFEVLESRNQKLSIFFVHKNRYEEIDSTIEEKLENLNFCPIEIDYKNLDKNFRSTRIRVLEVERLGK